jgi:AAA+ ATPase superfamily predicted ATPase
MIHRDAEDYLQQWYLKKHRKPLVIRGARQVGKSTLVREFSKRFGYKLIEINLEKHLSMEDVFKRLDVKEILNEISILTGEPLIASNENIIFLDEIQATPSAIPTLRYLYAEIDFLIQAGQFPIPVEVKSGKSGSLKSLHIFCDIYQYNKAVRLDLNTPSVFQCNHKISSDKRVSYELVSLPLYMVEEIKHMIGRT